MISSLRLVSENPVSESVIMQFKYVPNSWETEENIVDNNY